MHLTTECYENFHTAAFSDQDKARISIWFRQEHEKREGKPLEKGLTLKDLHEIAKSFNKTLSGIFHHRIEYPEVDTKSSRKGRNGNTDHLSTEDSGVKKPEDKAEGEEGLRRLGLS